MPIQETNHMNNDAPAGGLSRLEHHQEQMEALRQEFAEWWKGEFLKLKNMKPDLLNDDACIIAWRAYRQARSKRWE
jgi:hypothetical protein